jgi:ribonuclease P protein component
MFILGDFFIRVVIMKKEYRVKKGSDIERIMKQRQSFGNKYFVMYKLYRGDQNHFRYAISVPKKLGHAVDRNKIKRQIRSIIAGFKIKDGYDLFIVCKPMANQLTFNNIQIHLEDFFVRLDVKGE